MAPVNKIKQVINLDESGQKLIRTEIYKTNLIQPNPNPWWIELARGFRPTLPALLLPQVHTHTHFSKQEFNPNLTTLYYKSIRKVNTSLTCLWFGQETPCNRVHYIVTNTHSLTYPRRCETFHDIIFISPTFSTLIKIKASSLPIPTIILNPK